MADTKAETLAFNSIAIADDTLLQQLIWVLMEKGVFSKPEMIAALHRCVDVNRKAAGPANRGAAAHLEQIRKNIETSAGLAPRIH